LPEEIVSDLKMTQTVLYKHVHRMIRAVRYTSLFGQTVILTRLKTIFFSLPSPGRFLIPQSPLFIGYIGELFLRGIKRLKHEALSVESWD